MPLSITERQRAAYERTRAASERLHFLADKWNREFARAPIIGCYDDWSERQGDYQWTQREWDVVFAEFNDAVNEYAAALNHVDSIDHPISAAPRKPR